MRCPASCRGGRCIGFISRRGGRQGPRESRRRRVDASRQRVRIRDCLWRSRNSQSAGPNILARRVVIGVGRCSDRYALRSWVAEAIKVSSNARRKLKKTLIRNREAFDLHSGGGRNPRHGGIARDILRGAIKSFIENAIKRVNRGISEPWN